MHPDAGVVSQANEQQGPARLGDLYRRARLVDAVQQVEVGQEAPVAAGVGERFADGDALQASD